MDCMSNHDLRSQKFWILVIENEEYFWMLDDIISFNGETGFYQFFKLLKKTINVPFKQQSPMDYFSLDLLLFVQWSMFRWAEAFF